MTVLQRVMAVVLAVLGACSLGLAIASATLWRPDDVVTATAAPAGQATMIVTEPGVLGLVADEVTITASRADGGPVAVVVGREADVRGWLGTDAHALVTGLASWTELASSDVTGDTTPVPDPSAEETPAEGGADAPFVGASGIVGPDPVGSDMWLAESHGTGSASLRIDQRLGREMLLVAGTGDGALTPTLTLSWPRDVSTPALVPGVILGIVLLLAAAALVLLPTLPRLALRVVEVRNRRTAAATGSVQVAPGSPHGGPIVAPTSRFAEAPARPAVTSQGALAGAGPTSALRDVSTGGGAPALATSAPTGLVPAEGDPGRPLTRRELRERAEREAAAAAQERGRKRPRTGMLPQVRSRADEEVQAGGPSVAAAEPPAAPAAGSSPEAQASDEIPSARADAWRAAWGFQAGAPVAAATPGAGPDRNPYLVTPVSASPPSAWTPDGHPSAARTEEDS